MKSRFTLVASAAFILASAAGAAALAGPAMSVDEAKAVLSKFKVAEPELFIGDRAPDLKIGTWVQGEPVSEFVPGHTYVVEMWATWCGPCIAAIPHLNELSLKYKADEKPVTFIGTNIWERMSDGVRETAVKEFIEARNGQMTYTVAIEEHVAGNNPSQPKGLMAETWMKPAGQNGIPAAFIVDGQGRVAWIGHPMTIDQPLEKIVAGEWDVEQAAADALNEQRGGELLNTAMPMLASATTAAEGYTLLEAASLTAFAENAGYLSGLAGYVVTAPEDQVAVRNHDLAGRMAERACELGAWKDAGPIGTLAMVQFKKGDAAAAEKHLRKAMEVAGDDVAELNEMAWTIVSDEEAAKAFAPLAVEMATKACEACGWDEADVIDTLARAQWESGDKDAAIATQAKAVAAADEDVKAQYEETLNTYKAGK